MKLTSSSLIFLPAVSFILFSLIGQVHGSLRCAHWCDQNSCDKEQCSDCPVCKVQANYCAPWCNVYTCPVQYCDGCCVCESLKAEAHCEPWCNSFSCWVRGGYCSGCASCGGDIATTNRLKSKCEDDDGDDDDDDDDDDDCSVPAGLRQCGCEDPLLDHKEHYIEHPKSLVDDAAKLDVAISAEVNGTCGTTTAATEYLLMKPTIDLEWLEGGQNHSVLGNRQHQANLKDLAAFACSADDNCLGFNWFKEGAHQKSEISVRETTDVVFVSSSAYKYSGDSLKNWGRFFEKRLKNSEEIATFSRKPGLTVQGGGFEVPIVGAATFGGGFAQKSVIKFPSNFNEAKSVGVNDEVILQPQLLAIAASSCNAADGCVGFNAGQDIEGYPFVVFKSSRILSVPAASSQAAVFYEKLVTSTGSASVDFALGSAVTGSDSVGFASIGSDLGFDLE